MFPHKNQPEKNTLPQPAQKAQSFSEREEAISTGETAAALREDAADLREQVANLRDEASNLRQTNLDEQEKAGDLRHEAAELRHEAAELRHEAAELRQETADLRDKSLVAQVHADSAKNELRILNEARMREVNERLVIASVHAQSMREVAEHATLKMSHLAEHDFLTGLPNRVQLNLRLTQAIALAQRNGKKVALMYLDLDHFKHINDSLGHAVGDQLLQSAASRLQTCVRISDIVSRHGGDEFVVLLAEVEEAHDAAIIADKFIQAMSEPHVIGQHRLHVTLSIGISLYPDDGYNAEGMVRNADIAMYQAKKSGRNNFKVFTPDMNARAIVRQSVEQALHHALEQQQFVLHYQPKVNLQTGIITGAEALIRLQQPERLLISPEQFVSIAEDSGLILPIGNWVLREACQQAKSWLDAGLDIGQIAVNISAREFHSKNFLAGLRAILDETGLDAERLEMEVTESVLMQDTRPTTALLHALKDLGVRIAVDDFGTGYSSLSYLLRFPIDTLKIDQSFVQDIDGSAGEAIVNAIIAMGASLKHRVVAEGIETRLQLDILQSCNCAEGQGFLFSHPVMAKEFAALL